MTLKNLIVHEELFRLAGDPAGRDELLLRALSDGQSGITRERLESIRQYQGTPYDRIHLAAEVLFKSLLELSVPQTDIAASFTVSNLAALVYEEWSNPKRHRDNVGDDIRRRHKKELRRIRAEYRFKDIDSPQLLRETISYDGVPLYQGNLYQARAVWEKFQPSNEDFLLNTSIPLTIGPLEALLLGIYWADGHLRRSKKSVTLVLDGEESDLNNIDNINMYGDLIAHLLREIHNYGPISSHSYVRRRISGGSVLYTPSFEINSKAVCTWLRDDLGFPPPQRTVEKYVPKRLPLKYLGKLEFDAMQAFFAGLIAGLGMIDESECLIFEHSDRKFIQDIADLSRLINYNPSQVVSRPPRGHGNKSKNPIWYVAFSTEEVYRMIDVDLDISLPYIHRGLFFNPRHYLSPVQPTP